MPDRSTDLSCDICSTPQPGDAEGNDFAAEVARLGRDTLEKLARDSSPAAKEEALLSAMLSEKIRRQAKEIQTLLDTVEKLKEAAMSSDARPAAICAQFDQSPLTGLSGSDSVLVRCGPPSFKEHNQLVKQLSQLSKEYRMVNKKLEDVLSDKRQLRTELTAKDKECASTLRQKMALEKVLADTKAAYKEDNQLDGPSPVAGRKSNASADRQAMALLAKTVKSLQSKIHGLEHDKVELVDRVSAVQSTAEEEAAYINALKEALDLRSKENDGEMPVHSGMVEELVKARAAIAALRQLNSDLQKALDAHSSAGRSSGRQTDRDTPTHSHRNTHRKTDICTLICIQIHMYVHTYNTCTHTCFCICWMVLCMYVCMYECVHVGLFMYIHKYMHKYYSSTTSAHETKHT